jgi:hypothetical protein
MQTGTDSQGPTQTQTSENWRPTATRALETQKQTLMQTKNGVIVGNEETKCEYTSETHFSLLFDFPCNGHIEVGSVGGIYHILDGSQLEVSPNADCSDRDRMRT